MEVVSSQKLSAITAIRFAMSTRVGGVSPEPYGMNMSFSVGDAKEHVTENRRRFFDGVGILPEQIALPKQCHSATVVPVDAGGEYKSCDGLVSATPGIWLGISVADCVPIILADPRTKAVAALHAGWRGTRQRIVEKGMSLMSDAFGSKPEHIVAYIGPSAGVCCYQVGVEVAEHFSSPVLTHKNGSVYLDLKLENKRQLQAAGVPIEQIETSPHCTICAPDRFHSYRREKERSGRMMAVVGILL
ncbi:MAG TPA: peptidoglycan editing factor PgeF [Bacteroidota bacterium]